MHIFLMCGGKQTRMGGLSAPLKQLTPFRGTPLILRTAQQIDTWIREPYKLTLVAPFTAEWSNAAQTIQSSVRASLFTQAHSGLDAFMPAALHFMHTTEAPAAFLCGDVAWSARQMHRLLNTCCIAPDASFVVRNAPNLITGRASTELYAFVIGPRAWEKTKAICTTRLAYVNGLLASAPAELHAALTEKNFRPWTLLHHLFDQDLATVFDVPGGDYTDDIDSPEDIKRVPLMELHDIAKDIAV